MQKRDKSPIIHVNLMKENIHTKPHSLNKNGKSSKASLNLVKVLATRRSDMNSLWEPPEDQKQHSNRFDNYFQRHSTRRSNAQTSRERERDFSDSPKQSPSHHQCVRHINKTQQRKRIAQNLCCLPQCDTHLLCRECKHKIIQCKHDQIVKLTEFIEQPILIFLKKDNQQSELIGNLILQQMQLFNKVKFQAEQSKQQMQEYLENIQDQLKMKCQVIQTEFNEKVDFQLRQIRTDIDQLVQTSLVYKDDFDNRLNQNDDFVESVKLFKQQSEDPYEQVMNQVNQLQQNLNKIPQLNSLVLELKTDITIKDFSYSKLII
ncbi:unnamed protein product (macronuclear) [Paramecium tetraurelia]|uniref:B box-type domain-containing protein n=1 Tax=Paramecium tetraurelia TaxID=5888 RepID=A0CB35_PARTE|nr:uncharacterized protein GSPATT00036785001 [Paramecium tetraurelia]CAK68002.1 unnamed protein product [Paramecium tetraurelia]|eukprot:XP_001435399.1 hypothetical protein (macronuclear) [Paramecium tetraurelia strain d4-2]